MSITISQASANNASSLTEVGALLQEVGLPAEGVAAHFSHFLLAREEGKLCGCVGLEIYDDVALLRSLAVAPTQQKTGLGKLLTENILAHARAANGREIVLLTTTAHDFFVNKFGFTVAPRDEYNEKLALSPEWNLPRCSSAVLLRREL